MEIQQEKKIDMKQKQEEKLSLYGLKVSDLTKDELRQLEEEIRLEEKGHVILDGVLSTIPLYGRENDK